MHRAGNENRSCLGMIIEYYNRSLKVVVQLSWNLILISQAGDNFKLIQATFTLMQSNQQQLLGRKHLKSGRQETNKLVQMLQKVVVILNRIVYTVCTVYPPEEGSEFSSQGVQFYIFRFN